MKLEINTQWRFMPYLFVAAVAIARLAIHHPYNFIPVFTCLVFFASMRPRREYAFPLLLLTGVDIYLTVFRYGYPITSDHAVTWLWYLLAMLAGGALLQGSSWALRNIGCSPLASISFFAVSNFAVWACWQMYPKTLAGLGACYWAALPFFRNGLASEMVASVLVFWLVPSVCRWPETRATLPVCS